MTEIKGYIHDMDICFTHILWLMLILKTVAFPGEQFVVK